MARSRNYPAMSLQDAIERARVLYEREGVTLTMPEAIVAAWGYSSLNGSSLRVLSALRQFGLLDDVGDKSKISDRALVLLLEEASNPIEWAHAVIDAANEPSIYQDIKAAYPDGIGSKASIKAHLVRREGFKDAPAEKLIDAYTETMSMVQEVKIRYLKGDDPKQALEQQKQEPDNARDLDRRAGDSVVSKSQRGVMPGFQEIPIKLSSDTSAFLTVPMKMDAAQVKRLKSFLTFWMDWELGNPQETQPDATELGIPSEEGEHEGSNGVES